MISTRYAVSLSMRLHEVRNKWNYFYRPRLVADVKALPETAASTWADVVFQLRLAFLVALLGWVTNRLETLTIGK